MAFNYELLRGGIDMKNGTNLCNTCNETMPLYVEKRRRREKHEKRNPKQATDWFTVYRPKTLIVG
jgi:hypothetical protein